MADELHIRWMIRHDMPQVQNIEDDSFEWPWSEEEFIRCLRQRNSIGMVATYGDTVAGFMVYELNKSHLDVLDFAVAAEYRRRGVGSAMVAKLVSKLSHQRRKEICLSCRERNLAGQVFFRSQGFRAVNVLRDFYEDTTEDAIRFVYSIHQHAEALNT